MAVEPNLQFARLDSVAANLDLLIDASKKFQLPVFPKAHQISRAIEPLAGMKLNEPFRRHFRLLAIPASYSRAGDVKFARHAHWHGPHITIQHINLRIGDWFANRWRRSVVPWPYLSRGCDHAVLSRAVMIDQRERQCS